jgi:hypothetical protein
VLCKIQERIPVGLPTENTTYWWFFLFFDVKHRGFEAARKTIPLAFSSFSCYNAVTYTGARLWLLIARFDFHKRPWYKYPHLGGGAWQASCLFHPLTVLLVALAIYKVA